jgi:hypothetical protein
MTTQKTFKRRVRSRMAKTGESYTAARAQLLAMPEPVAEPAPEPPTRVQEVTGRTHEQWFALLDEAGAAAMTHAQIATWLREEHDVGSWWAQNVTVEYERARGRRAVHQNAAGHFYAGASRTIRRPAVEVHAAIEARLGEWELNRRRPARGWWCARTRRWDGSRSASTTRATAARSPCSTSGFPAPTRWRRPRRCGGSGSRRSPPS